MRTGYRDAKVVVAGGGAAGVVAAIASARQGVDTLLVERQGFLGGMFTGGNMTVLTTPSVGGLGKEIVDGLMAQGAARHLLCLRLQRESRARRWAWRAGGGRTRSRSAGEGVYVAFL